MKSAVIRVAGLLVALGTHTTVRAQDAAFYTGPVTPLTAAVWNERVDEARRLLAGGADPNQPAGKPELSPWQAAVIAGHQATLDLFASHDGARPSSQRDLEEQHGVAASGRWRPGVPPRTAAMRALVLLEAGGAQWNERQGCASCHHQGLLVPVAAVARRQGFVVNEERAQAQEARLRSMLTSMEPRLRAAVDGEDGAVRFGLGFFGQATSGYAWLLNALASATGRSKTLDEFTAVAIGRTQLPSGRWRVGAPRLPIQESDIQTTALVIRVLLTFAPTHPETAWRVERARAWLLSSGAVTAHDRAYRLLGLRWSGADHADIKEAMKALLKEQGDDGGWAPLPGLNADAYATGLALVALREGADMAPAHRAYQRGIAFLVRTQEDDGSWFVQKRAAAINPYFESGFPHGMHQFSSFAGTAWATMALMYAAGSGTP